MFRPAHPFMLAIGLLSSACGPDTSNNHGAELAGDGSRAYYKLASTWCERAIGCLDEAGYGMPWASAEICAERTADRFSVRGDNGCAAASDFKADAKELGACLNEIAGASCASTLSPSPLIQQVRFGALPQCHKVAEQLAEAEDERAGAAKLGAACGDGVTSCGWEAYCDARSEESCGKCRALPKAGEKCVIDEEEGDAYCGLGFLCVDGVCKAGLPKKGESCTSQGYCDVGLDCGRAGVCTAQFAVGDACEAGSSCGEWLSCVDGRCAGGAIQGLQIGQSCDQEDDNCIGGHCVKGKCAPLAGLGEACPTDCGGDCDDGCQSPYLCLKGKCTEVPACNMGKRGAKCTASDQCGPGLGCVHNSDGPSQCDPIPAELGQSCSTEKGCFDGICLKGVCTLGELGDPCDGYMACRSRSCDYETGECTAPALVCE